MVNTIVKKDNGVSGWFWLIPIILVIVGVGFWVCKGTAEKLKAAGYPIAADAREIWLREGRIVVDICPDGWTRWVNRPAGAVFDYKSPGWLDFFLSDGRIIHVGPNERKDLGDIRRFRLRGEDEVVFVIRGNQNPVSYY